MKQKVASYLSEQASEDSEGTANAVRSTQPLKLQMPNYELIAKFYTEHSTAQAHSSILQPCDFRNQINHQLLAQNQQPSHISCIASPTTHLFGLLDMRVAGEEKNSL